MKTTFYKLIQYCATAALDLQRVDGSMPPGQNSPHNDVETPARNTAFWLIVWRFYAETVDPSPVIAAMQRGLDYLLSDEIRPQGFNLRARISDCKDQCNGVIGPAYCVEGLVSAGEFLDRHDALELAAAIVGNHQFDEDRRLWRTWDIDGSIGNDNTLNHQIWWCMAIAMLNSVGISVGSREVGLFLEGLEKNMELNRYGRIRHLVGGGSSQRKALKGLMAVCNPRIRREINIRENAYHAYNLYPLALLKKMRPDEELWQSVKLRKAIEYLNSDEYVTFTRKRKFLEPWTPGGFLYSYVEHALVEEVFGDANRERHRSLLQMQVDRAYNKETGFFNIGGQDNVTQPARIYEATRVSDAEIIIP